MTALGVGGATVLGSLLGFLFHHIPHKWNDAILGFAAGVMLAASFVGLILPSIQEGGRQGALICTAGLVCGGLFGLLNGIVVAKFKVQPFFLNAADRLTPQLHHITGVETESHAHNEALDKIMLFVLAIAIHNLPEGMAAGVGAGSGDWGNSVTVTAGIMLQNIPEGMIIISPMVLGGVRKGRAFLIGAFTGMIEVAGVLIGYFAVSVSAALLPFAMAFAGGTMLYIISDEMIPETHSHGFERMATYSLIAGVIVMLLMDFYIS